MGRKNVIRVEGATNRVQCLSLDVAATATFREMTLEMPVRCV
jgi:hypothetical protein